MPPAGLQPPSGAVVDASTAFVALNLLAIGTSGRTVAGVCATSESSVKRIQRHAAQHSGGARVPRKGKGKRHDRRWHFGGAPGQSNLGRLDRLVGSMDASSTHDEIYAAYVATCPLPVPKPSTVAEALRKLEYTTKRLSAYAPDRNDLRCRAWYQRVASLYRRHQFVCIDEVGVNEKSANRNRGRSKRGTPAVTHLNVLAGGSKKSALGVFTEEGFIDVHVVDGAFDTDAFFTAIDESVIPHMRPYPGPRSVLLIDNCRIHNPRERVHKVGGRLIFLEPYDPQHMPIEVGFRAMKRWMRKNRELIRDMPPYRRIRLAARCVTHAEAHQAFAASGF